MTHDGWTARRRARRRPRRGASRAALLVVAMLLTGSCSGAEASRDGATTVATPTTTGRVAGPPPPGVTIVAELGYPRDLYERGRVNLVTTRTSDEAFTVLSKQLRAAFFTPADVEQRMSVIPSGGQPVAVQAPFGTVHDCTTDDAVTASVDFTYRYGDDPTIRQSSFPLADAQVLDDIRARVCTARRVLEVTDVHLSEPVVEGESMTLDVTLSRRRGADTLAVESVGGTVLFGADATRATQPLTLAPGDRQLTIPLTVMVNRCDAHAVAETTRRWGIDLWVSVDRRPAQPVPLPIDDIVDDMDTMLETCRVRTGGR